MKRLLYFIFLNVFSLAISMDDPSMQLRNYINRAEQAESLGKKDEALDWYGRAANVSLLAKPDWGDPYEQAREWQQKGARKIFIEAMKLKNQKQYDEAIKVYQYAVIDLKQILRD